MGRAERIDSGGQCAVIDVRRWLAAALLACGAIGPVSAQVAPAQSAVGQDIRAQLMPRRFTTVVAEVGAKINRLPVAEGGTFKTGQLLVELNCSMQQALLQKARAEQSGAQQTLKSNQRLLELNSIGQLELDLSKAALDRATAEVGAQQAVLEKCTLVAPFAGRVAEQKVREQQYVQPGQALLDILDDSVLELEFLVPSRWLVWLRAGQKFDVDIDETGQSYPAKFIRIGARVDPVSQSVKVTAAIDGHFPELMTGMSGRVRVSEPSAQRSK